MSAGLAAPAAAAHAGGGLGGAPAPAWIQRSLAFQARTESEQDRSAFGTPLAGEATVVAALDARSFVWGAPTDTGGYCVGLTRPGRRSGFGCATPAAGMISSYLDCNETVVVGGRIPKVAREAARSIELRRAGRRVLVPVRPARRGFFIARLPASFFAGARSSVRATWARFRVVDAGRRGIPPANVTGGRLPPPAPVACPRSAG